MKGVNITETFLKRYLGQAHFIIWKDTCTHCGGGYFYEAIDKSWRFKILNNGMFKIVWLKNPKGSLRGEIAHVNLKTQTEFRRIYKLITYS